jgi:formate dehydrogenase subunit gamma
MQSSTAPRLIAALLTTFTLLWASAQSASPEVRVTSTAPAASALAATGASMTTAPAGFVAPTEPKPDDSNAERAKSQPGNNAPFWRGVRESGVEKGISNLPGAEKGVLIQEFVQYPGSRLASAGEAWRQVRNKWIIPYGGSLFVITLLALALFYFKKGSLGGHVPYTGRLIERFTYFERAAHWSNAIAFCALAISGLVIAFGKFLLLPVIGASLFGWLTFALKNVHNFAGPLFAVSLVVVFITFVRDNIPNLADLTWLRKGGGLFGGEEVPSGRFNAGEKVVFWGGVFALGLVVIASGLVLDELVPGMAYLRGDMQIANMVHGIATVLMMVMFTAHIYLGTIGMKDAYNGMKTGLVDEGWAKEHHELWFDDVRSGKVPYQRTLPAAAKSANAANAAKPAAQH